MKSAAERFDEKWTPEPNTGCWLWFGATSSVGYGTFHDGHGWRAHRYAYERWRGPIPEGLQIDHLCRVRCCVNPAHMEPVTNRVNVLRGVGPCAVNGNKATCVRGHRFDDPRARRWCNKDGRRERICRECRRLRQIATRALARPAEVK